MGALNLFTPYASIAALLTGPGPLAAGGFMLSAPPLDHLPSALPLGSLPCAPLGSTLTPLRSGSSWREVRVAFSSQRLVAARVAAGLTQQQLADALGANKGRISEWERGVSQPRASRVPAIASTLNVDALELMADDYEHLDLEALRLAAGLSRQALAAAVGMTLPRYQRLEAGERTSELPEDLLQPLARILSVPMVTLRVAAENSRDRGLRRRYGEHME